MAIGPELEKKLRFAYPVVVTRKFHTNRGDMVSYQTGLFNSRVQKYIDTKNLRSDTIKVCGQIGFRSNIRVGDQLMVRTAQKADEKNILRGVAMNQYDNIGCATQMDDVIFVSGSDIEMSARDLFESTATHFRKQDIDIGCLVRLPNTNQARAGQHDLIMAYVVDIKLNGNGYIIIAEPNESLEHTEKDVFIGSFNLVYADHRIRQIRSDGERPILKKDALRTKYPMLHKEPSVLAIYDEFDGAPSVAELKNGLQIPIGNRLNNKEYLNVLREYLSQTPPRVLIGNEYAANDLNTRVKALRLTPNSLQPR